MMSSGRPARKPPAFTASSMRGNFVVAASRGSHRRDLLVGQCPHEAQFAEHLHVLFVMRGGLADRLLAAGRDVELVAERQPLAQFELDVAPRISRSTAPPSAEPPSMPYFAMKFRARSERLWMPIRAALDAPLPLARVAFAVEARDHLQ